MRGTKIIHKRVVLTILVLAVGGCAVLTICFAPIRDFLRIYELMRNDAAVAAEHQYSVMEENLRMHLENYEDLHPEYHEYGYALDEIGHERDVLLSILFALHGEAFSFAEVQSTLDMLFEKQYVITEDIAVKTKYVNGEETDYFICTVRLANYELAAVSEHILDAEQLVLYSEALRYFESRMER